jgi:hypothetical protein
MIGSFVGLYFILNIWYKDVVVGLVGYFTNRKNHVLQEVEAGCNIPSIDNTFNTYHKYKYKHMIEGLARYGLFSTNYFGFIAFHVILIPLLGFFTCVMWPASVACHSYEWVKKHFLQTDHVVTRLLKNNPETLAKILEDVNHKYYSIAKKLETAGTISLNPAVGMITIDGKQYKVEIGK